MDSNREDGEPATVTSPDPSTATQVLATSIRHSLSMAQAAEPILASTIWLGLQSAKAPTEMHGGTVGVGRLKTGLQGLDAALEGGLDSSRICCLSAEPDIEVAQLTHGLLVSHLLADGEPTATVIDSSMSFDLRSLHDRITRQLVAQGMDVEAALAILKRLKIMKIFDFVGLTEAVSEVKEALGLEVVRGPKATIPDSQEDEDELLDLSATAKPASYALSPHLLIIDDISKVVGPLIKSNYAQGQALLASFMRSLSHLTKTHNLYTILTTDMTHYSHSTEDTPSIFTSCTSRPALGKSFSLAVDLHLLVHRQPRTAEDGRGLHAGRRGGRGAMGIVVEVFHDRYDGRVGGWAALPDDV